MTVATTANRLPRWRGFNLLDFFHTRSPAVATDEDFRWIAEWGFDFVRLPMCYLLWTREGEPCTVREEVLAQVDRAVELGRRCGLHICLNLHRAPGYSVNPERREPFDLWHDAAAQEAFCFHWELFARRYRGIDAGALSFNLVNEPPAPAADGMTRADHERVMRAAAAAIWAIDPTRLVIVDGIAWGNEPLPELAGLAVAQSCRGYLPMGLTHYQAPWVGGEKFPLPAWPGAENWGERYDRARLEQHYARWASLMHHGVGVHCGECGCHSKTPHAVFLAWFRDVLEILQGHGIGWALWNFRGSFGVLDSGRSDVAYQEWHGHRLDAQLLALLRAH